MLTLAYPWLLALLPLPALIRWLCPPHREPRQALAVPFLDRLAKASGHRPADGAVVMRGSWPRGIVLMLTWAAIVLAMARPQIIEPALTKQVPVRDMLLAVDLSGSMDTKDFTDENGKTIDRLTAVKQVLDGFLADRKGDRVGLIFFGSAAFVQAPFTEDLKVCRQLLDEAQVRMAGPQTVFGDALGLAINTFESSTVKDRVLIALTDGNDTSSRVPPSKAAEIAKNRGIVIHTVAVGDPKAAGEEAIDVTTLKNVSKSTGGLYAYAADRAQLEAIYKKLDALETRQADTLSFRPRRDVYWWPLLFALGLTALLHVLGLARAWHRSRAVRSAPAKPPGGYPRMIADFHFIRPWLLLALLPLGLLLWRIYRRQDGSRTWRGIIAPDLLPFLLIGETKHRRWSPLLLIGIAWGVGVIAISGPTLRREPAPFATDIAALAIVVKVSPSMLTEDIQPSRLARSVQKIHDLLKLRRGAKTALIAYSGSPHLVMPPTTDAHIIDTFAQALDPKIMPLEGDVADQALRLADETLKREGGGSILWITDSAAGEQSEALESWRKTSSTKLNLLPPLVPGDELNRLTQVARSADAEIVQLTPDEEDITALARNARFATAPGAETSDRWQESGYWLTPFLALLTLPFFRKGWMAHTNVEGGA